MNVDQGGIGLPERDYYLKDDPKNVETREKILAHMTRMFTLAGDTPGDGGRAREERARARDRGSRPPARSGGAAQSRTTAITR